MGGATKRKGSLPMLARTGTDTTQCNVECHTHTHTHSLTYSRTHGALLLFLFIYMLLVINMLIHVTNKVSIPTKIKVDMSSITTSKYRCQCMDVNEYPCASVYVFKKVI